ncbi:hypothetical protein BKA93DRAFT_732216, partial [Sparassis latifolia]
TFNKLVIAIQNSPEFHNNSQNAQMPVEHQLAIFLYCFGHHDNAALSQKIADWGGVSVDTMYNCTTHCVMTVLALHDMVIHWSTANQKKSAQKCVVFKVCKL